MSQPIAEALAAEVRVEEKLPAHGRNSEALARMERLFREAMAPDIPSFDVNRVQSARFDEWCYTEGPDIFCAFTQSIEINTRLALEAAAYEDETDLVTALVASLLDKWELQEQRESAAGKSVFFPPGGNASWIVNDDNVMRAFETDPSWMLKPHPITVDDDVWRAKMALGITRLYDRDSKAMPLLREAARIGYTTASETGLVAMMLGKPSVDFSKYQFEAHGCYYSLYRAIRESDRPGRATINRLLNCPWSGLLPMTMDDEAAVSRFRLFKAKTIELRERFAPLVRITPVPPVSKE